jgi:phosphoribosylanthranilate isomerase
MGVHVVCTGLTRIEDVEAVVDAGVDYIGFVLGTTSGLPLDRAADLALGARGVGFEGGLVGVFTDAEAHLLEEAAVTCDLDVLRLDGDEPPERVQAAQALRPVWKTLRIEGEGASLSAEAARFETAEVLVLSERPGVAATDAFRSDPVVALARERRVVFTGGFDAESVGSLAGEVDPFGVEVPAEACGGGRLDAARLAAFLAAVREGERSA